ncbi:MAG: SPOR domain-containing protein [Planctomycetota bacterium]|nr:SPOR domain-containing protein [Planctomycetota bacterium]
MQMKWTAVWALALAAGSGGAGCTQLSPEGRTLLESGYDAAERGDNQGTINAMDKFLDEHGKSHRADEGYYLRGLAHYRAGHRSDARADFAKALDETSKKEVRGKARLALGDIAWDDDDMPEAEKNYRDALKDLPADEPPTDRVYYRTGAALQRMGKWEEAAVEFHRVMELFKNSPFAAQAARRVNASGWTIQVGAFKVKSAADQAVAKLRQSGIAADARPTTEGGQGLAFLVQAGSYASYEDALSALGRIRQSHHDAFIAPK